MVKSTKKQVGYLLAIISLVIMFSGCANQLPPGGGEVDKIPPQIEEIYPTDGTTNFSDDHIEIDFSEYVVKSSLNSSVFISPHIDGQLEYSWTGKGVEINFPGPLKRDVTYVITIGTDLVDENNKNRMASSYTLTFSTGDKIDRRSISGKVYTENPNGIFIFAYKKSRNKIIDPFTVEPDYISQAGSDGTYKITGLAAGDYRIFAIMDQYKDYLFQPSQDEFGDPSGDVTLAENDSLLSDLDFMITKRDTVPPRMIRATMTDKYHILTSLSQRIDSTLINRDNFFLIDSTTNKEIIPAYAFKGTIKPEEVVLTINESIPTQDNVYLVARKLGNKFGNIFENDFSRVTVSDREDTSKPGIIKTIPPYGSQRIDFINPSFLFYFNDAFDKVAAKNAISLSDTLGNKIPIKIDFLDDATITISPDKNLLSNRDYQIKMDLNNFNDIAGNSYDTTYIYNFKTISGIDFTGLSGSVVNADNLQSPVLVLQEKNGDNKYHSRLSNDGKFEFKRIEPGDYSLWCFYDVNNNGKYDYGWPFPFEPAEKFFYYKTDITLKPRWTLTDIKFELK